VNTLIRTLFVRMLPVETRAGEAETPDYPAAMLQECSEGLVTERRVPGLGSTRTGSDADLCPVDYILDKVLTFQ